MSRLTRMVTTNLKRWALPQLVFVSVLLVVMPGAVAGQAHELFTDAAPNFGGSPEPDVDAIFDISLNLDGLHLGPSLVTVYLPEEGQLITFAQRAFDRIEGYDVEGNPTGTASETRYLWRGENGDWDMVLAVNRGYPSGTIISGHNHYKIVAATPLTAHLLLMGQMPLNLIEPSDAPPPLHTDPAVQALETKQSPDLEVKVVWQNPNRSAPVPVRKSQRSVAYKTILPEPVPIDILALYTETARQEIEGEETDPETDFNKVLALIDESFGLTNHAFENSGSLISFRVVAIASVSGFTPSGRGIDDVVFFKNSDTLQTLRAAENADMVTVLLRSYLDPTINYCGYAFVQHKNCWDYLAGDIAGCNQGIDFRPFALNVVAHDCAARWLVTPHELAHGLGCEHAISETHSTIILEKAASYFSYGHIASQFATISVQSHSENRVLYVASPDVFYMGEPTGTWPFSLGESSANCLRTAEEQASLMSSTRTPQTAVVKIGDFESGDFSFWEIGSETP